LIIPLQNNNTEGRTLFQFHFYHTVKLI